MDVELFVSNDYLYVQINNNTNKSFYFNKWSVIDSLHITDSDGNDFTDQYITNEFIYHKRYILKDRKILGKEKLIDYEDLFSPPLTERKKLVKLAVETDFNTNYIDKLPKNITLSDIELVKSIIFSKYSNSIFIDPKSTYRDSLSIYTLSSSNKKYKIKLEHNTMQDVEFLKLDINNGRDTIIINSKPLHKIDKYNFYSGLLKSNVLHIN